MESYELVEKLEEGIGTGWGAAAHKEDMMVLGFILKDIYIDGEGSVQDGSFSLDVETEYTHSEVGNISIHEKDISDAVREVLEEYWSDVQSYVEERQDQKWRMKEEI